MKAKFKSATEVQITRDGNLQQIEFYEKNSQFFVFDREGNCFRTINKLDEVERTKDTVVDSD